MNWAFVRREWGAVVFVVTVLIGMIVVPTALILNKQQSMLVQSAPPTASAPSASPTGSATPTPRSPSPSPSPSR